MSFDKPSPEEDYLLGKSSYTITITAPGGFEMVNYFFLFEIFTRFECRIQVEDCLEGLETRSEKVFGLLANLPSIYSPWPTRTTLISCKG